MQIGPPLTGSVSGRQIPEKFAGTEYLVFIDESFFKFFGFGSPNGSFCHAAVGIPCTAYQTLQAGFHSQLRHYEATCLRTLGQSPQELKYTMFQKLPFQMQK